MLTELKNHKIFFSKNLFYRKLALGDANKTYLSWVNKNNFIVNKKKNLEDLRKYIKVNQHKEFYGIFDNKNNKHIGTIKFEKFKNNSLILGVLIGDKNYQNKNYFSEILNIFSNKFYLEKKITNIYLSVEKKNIQAIKSYKKNNFIIKKNFKHDLLMLYKRDKNHDFKKIIIGTAQFYSKYGVVNKKNKDPKELIIFANKVKLNLFETSTLYKKSIKKIIKNSLNSKFIIKISSKKINKYITHKEFEKKIKKFIQSIGINRIYAFMFHDQNFMDKKNFCDYQKLLQNICKKNSIKLGYSIYNMKEFNFLVKNYQLDLIQIPLNIFNQEFINNKFKKIVMDRKLEVHARSVFLQGILTNKQKDLPKKFHQFKKYLLYWENFCKIKKITKVNASINFVLNQSFVNKIVLGFKDNFELIDLINNFEIKKILYSANFKKIPLKLKQPSLWHQIK